jgi:hypothetical protein
VTIRHATRADQGAVLTLLGMYQTSLNFGREID